jgi:hypothetical protein
MRRTIKGGIAGVILALACCSNGLAQGADADWDRCLQRPTRACNLLFSAIRPWPGQKRDPKLIAESVPQLLRMAQSIDERRRAEVLIVTANALSN